MVAEPAQYVLRVLVVRTCNDDGATLCSNATKADVQESLHVANAINVRSNSGIKFELDPQSDFTGHVNSTLLNQDCIVPGGVTPELMTKQDVNNDGKVGDAADANLVCDFATPNAARAAFALQYPHRIVVFSRTQALKAIWDDATKHWTVQNQDETHSACEGVFIAMNESFRETDVPDKRFAHEAGHYLCSPHTFGPQPADLPAAIDIIKNYVGTNKAIRDNQSLVLKVFDPDVAFQIFDTKPDPFIWLYQSVFHTEQTWRGDPAHGNWCPPGQNVIKFDVTYPPDKKKFTYKFETDKTNVMSYFFCSPEKQHFSPGQVARHIATLTGVRRHLLEDDRTPCYSDKGLTKTPAGLSFIDLVSYRARIVAECTLAPRRLRPGEINMVDRYVNNPGEVLNRTLVEIRQQHPARMLVPSAVAH